MSLAAELSTTNARIALARFASPLDPSTSTSVAPNTFSMLNLLLILGSGRGRTGGRRLNQLWWNRWLWCCLPFSAATPATIRSVVVIFRHGSTRLTAARPVRRRTATTISRSRTSTMPTKCSAFFPGQVTAIIAGSRRWTYTCRAAVNGSIVST